MESITTFDQLAVGLGLHYEAAEVPAVPFEPSSDAGNLPRLYLVTLSRPGAAVSALHLIYTLRTFGMRDEPPHLGDVMFYLAVRAWQLVRADSDRARWLGLVGIDRDGPASSVLFAQEVRLVNHLQLLLGRAGYDALLRSYQADLADGS